MATITIKRYVAGADAGTITNIDGKIDCSMTQLLGKVCNGRVDNAMRYRNYINGYNCHNKENPWVTGWRVHDLNVAAESIKAHGHNVIIEEP